MSEKSFTYSGSQNIIDGSSVHELAMSDAHFANEEAATQGYLSTRQGNASSSNAPAMAKPGISESISRRPPSRRQQNRYHHDE